MIDPLSNHPGYLLYRISNALQDELSILLSQLDLRTSDASFLILIEANPNITPSALGQLLGVQRANMVPAISRLEKKGLTQRIPLDGRSFGLSFTDAGRTTCAKVHQIIKRHEENIISRIPEENREPLLAGLNALYSTSLTTDT